MLVRVDRDSSVNSPLQFFVTFVIQGRFIVVVAINRVIVAYASVLACFMLELLLLRFQPRTTANAFQKSLWMASQDPNDPSANKLVDLKIVALGMATGMKMTIVELNVVLRGWARMRGPTMHCDEERSTPSLSFTT